MLGTADDPPPKRQMVVETALLACCLLLALFGTLALGQLGKFAELGSLAVRLIGGVPLPKANPVTSAARWGVLDATLVLFGSAASLLYRSKPLRWLRNVALTARIIAVAMSSFLAMQGIDTLVSNPARGDFAGLANLGTLIVHVVIPSIVGFVTVIAVVCLIVLRPSSGNPASIPHLRT